MQGVLNEEGGLLDVVDGVEVLLVNPKLHLLLAHKALDLVLDLSIDTMIHFSDFEDLVTQRS